MIERKLLEDMNKVSLKIYKYCKKEDDNFEYDLVCAEFSIILDKISYDNDSITIDYIDITSFGYRDNRIIITEDLQFIKIEIC